MVASSGVGHLIATLALYIAFATGVLLLIGSAIAVAMAGRSRPRRHGKTTSHELTGLLDAQAARPPDRS
jgi:hypothetical protein